MERGGFMEMPMRVIVADKMGIVASEVKRALQRKRRNRVEVLTAMTWVELKRLINHEGKTLVVIAQLIPGFKGAQDLARKVKEENMDVALWVYNGLSEEYGPEVDFRIPPTPKGELVGEAILSHLKSFIEAEAVGQLDLFHTDSV